MKEREMYDIMMFVFVDYDSHISEDKRKVWFQLFGHHSQEVGMLAAKMLLTNKEIYGAPKTSDFAAALDQVLLEIVGSETWGEAYDKWVMLAQSYGSYKYAECQEAYKKISPLGARAMGTSGKEWFALPVEENGIFKAQFRQRYEGLANQAKTDRAMAPSMHKAIEQVRKEVGTTEKDLMGAGDILPSLLKRLAEV